MGLAANVVLLNDIACDYKVGDLPARPVASARVAKALIDILKFSVKGAQLILKE